MSRRELTKEELDAEIARRLAAGDRRPVHLIILHDDDGCSAPEAPCSCTPSYVIEDLTAENVQRGARGERERRAEVRRRSLARAWRAQRGQA